MAEIMLAASSFIQELLYISKDIVWKDEKTAQECEDTDYAYDVELYISAMRGDLTFSSILFFDYDVLVTAGISSTILDACLEDRDIIPMDMRDYVVSLQMKKIINTYEERNNYYRSLYGLPDIGDTDYIYNTKYPDISDSTTPIHLLPITQLYSLEANGYLEELYRENPTKKYLRHLGIKKITPYAARIAERFSILYINSSEFTRINTDFRDTYNACRYALLRSMYVPEKRKSNDLYDNFMAMCVLFMTIQQMQAKYLDADITRDFYDYESLKYVYDSYNVPFYPSIPLEYHTKIIKNINILMRHKGSTTVFFKLFDIFDFGSMDVFDFYILKNHRFENGKPVFKYNADGTEDTRAMYEIKFGQVQLYNNPPLELSDPSNHVEYEKMTLNDPYWITDKDLLDKLYNTEFNYIESKYIGIRTVFDLMSIVYESCYFFKMMLDNRESNQYVMVYFSALNQTIDLFTLIIYIAALMCKKYGYEGALDGDYAYIAKMMGFNFKEDLSIIQEYIQNHPELSSDTELINLLTNMNVSSLSSINTTFGKIQSLHKLFINRRVDAKTRNAFHAYTELEKILMTSKYAKEVFMKSDGNLASTFADLLGDLNSQLYSRYTTVGTEIDNELETLLVMMRQNITNLKYIEMISSSGSNVMIEHLFKLLEFFKSAKAELTGYEIGYTLAKRGDSILKFFSEITGGSSSSLYNDMLDVLTDELIETGVKRQFIAELLFKVSMTLDDINHHASSILPLADELIMITEIFSKQGIDFKIHDILHLMHSDYQINDCFEMSDRLDLIGEKIYYQGNEFLINDIIDQFTDKLIKSFIGNRYSNKSEFRFLDSLVMTSEKIIQE